MRYRCVIRMEATTCLYFSYLMFTSIIAIAGDDSASEAKAVALFVTHFEGDAISYRTKEENERIKNDEDPLKIFKMKVTEAGLLKLDQLEKIETEAKAKIKIAIEESKKAEFPTSKDLLTDVYIKY